MTFTVEELAALAYPGVNCVEKKHRVAVRRAADKVAAREWWTKSPSDRPGQPIVYFNLLNHRGYAIGRVRGSCHYHEASHAEIGAALDGLIADCIAAENWRTAMQDGGAFWLEVEINIAKRAGDHARVEALRRQSDGAQSPADREKLMRFQSSSVETSAGSNAGGTARWPTYAHFALPRRNCTPPSRRKSASSLGAC
jgi:hypothetical protein